MNKDNTFALYPCSTVEFTTCGAMKMLLLIFIINESLEEMLTYFPNTLTRVGKALSSVGG